MNKKIIIFLIIISLTLGYYFNIERDIKNKVNQLSNSISSTFLINIINIESTIGKYFNQTKYIDKLKKINEENDNYKVLYNIKDKENQELQKLLNIDYKHEYKFEKVKVLSYVKLNDNSKVMIDYPLEDKDKIYAILTYDGFSAGIALKKENQDIAYLNNNDRCNYTIFIGDNNAPGITSGVNSSGRLVIKHIPLWKDVNIDDEIITSGMDKIFPYGIKVGVVKEIIKGETTQEVFAMPYSKVLSERYFYLYDASK